MFSNKITVLIVGLALIGSTYFIYGLFQSPQDEEIRTFDRNSELQESVGQHGSEATKQASQTKQSSTIAGDPEPETAIESRDQDAQLDKFAAANLFMESAAFSSPSNLDKAFIRSDGVLESESLSHVFLQEDFNDVVSAIRGVEPDEISANREVLLREKLAKSFGSSVFDSNYACAGSLCAVTFQSVSEISDEELSAFARFDSNYTFANKTINDLGESTIKGLYILTDDPSSLGLSR